MSSLTLENLRLAPDEILNNSKINKYNNLLSNTIVNKYYSVALKKQIQEILRKYKDLQYIISYDDYSLKAVSNDFFNKGPKNKKSDPVGLFVENNLDHLMWETNIYNILLNLSKKLTFEEAVYLVDSFFDEKSEEQICEKMLICRKTLQRIKKSCLVKMRFDFEKNNLL